ncbi:hypothetical protein AV530_000801 [Patagioenas fasciata monilis]|uniref:Uncharacterized protein n=1 Tax=Patagioenas fasciata monilis TaxID=372326 RepID=A0A1V4KS90_PATFA|nr:hypothetical protein AV530_000801 [Patagioenas fasciata monilis]
MRYQAPKGVPGASWVCVWWDTLYLHMLLSNKELLDQISESQRQLLHFQNGLKGAELPAHFLMASARVRGPSSSWIPGVPLPLGRR